MTSEFALDEALVRRLPLPLAQLCRRAHNAKTASDRHFNAFSLWEAALKLLASVAVVEYAQRPDPDPKLAEALQALARPSLGNWWQFIRLLIPVLAEQGHEPWLRIRDLVLGRTRDDFPYAAGLDAVLRENAEGRLPARTTVRFTELIDRLVHYRNTVILGHGAPGALKEAFCERMARALLAAAAEVLGRLDVLAGRRLFYLAEARQSGGVWLMQRYELIGESARRIQPLELPREQAALLPDGDRVYLEVPHEGDDLLSALRQLHPLLLFDADAELVLFLNTRRGKQRIEYLCYTTGRTAERPELGSEQRELLGRVLGMPVEPRHIEEWAGRSHAEEPPLEPAPAAAAAARTLGEFELLSELGRGGMGVVYRAWQPSLGRQVAVKKLQRSGNAKAELRFAREIQALGRVEHPHLVKIFASGADGDEWFYAMELIEGAPLSAVCEKLQTASATDLNLQTWQETLSQVCAAARQNEKALAPTPSDANSPAETPPAKATSAAAAATQVSPASRSYVLYIVELIHQIAEAAHALHEKGILHRDIKPGNIMVSGDGSQPVLMDLGLAQLADGIEGRLTRTRQFVGTLRYASPQQVLAVEHLDRRSDVYSLGATLWELLALRPLFGATDQMPTPQLMEKIQRAEPQRLRQCQPGISRDLEAIVHRCLEKSAEHRYASAHDLARDLKRFLDGKPVQARPVRGTERAWKWIKRRPAVAGLYGSLCLAVLLGVALAVKHDQSASDQMEGLKAQAKLWQDKKDHWQEKRKAWQDRKKILVEARAEQKSKQELELVLFVDVLKKRSRQPSPNDVGHEKVHLRRTSAESATLREFKKNIEQALKAMQANKPGAAAAPLADALALVKKFTPSYQDYLREAYFWMNTGDNERAGEAARNALQKDETAAEGYYQQGCVYLREGNQQAAAALIWEERKQLAAGAPVIDDAVVKNCAEQTHNLRRQADRAFELALNHFQLALQRKTKDLQSINPDWPLEAMQEVWLLLASQKNYAEAVEVFAKLFEKEADNSDFAYFLGLALDRCNKGEEAEKALHTSLMLQPTDWHRHMAYGAVVKKAGLTAAAIKKYKQLGEKNKGGPAVLVGLAKLYLDLEPPAPKAALLLLHEAQDSAKLPSQDPQIRVELARGFARAGKPADAAKQFEAVLSEPAPNRSAQEKVLLLIEHGKALIRAGMLQGGIEKLESALRTHNSNGDEPPPLALLFELGHAYHRARKTEYAEEKFTQFRFLLKEGKINPSASLADCAAMTESLADVYVEIYAREQKPGLAEKAAEMYRYALVLHEQLTAQERDQLPRRRVQFGLVQTLAWQGCWEECIRLAEPDSLLGDKDFGRKTKFILAQAYQATGRPRKALDLLADLSTAKQAKKAEKLQAEALHFKSQVFLDDDEPRAGEVDEALLYLQARLSLAGGEERANTDPHVDLQQLSEALAQAKDLSLMLLYVRILICRQKKLDEASVLIEKIRKAGANSPQVLRRLGRVERQWAATAPSDQPCEHLFKALSHFERALELEHTHMAILDDAIQTTLKLDMALPEMKPRESSVLLLMSAVGMTILLAGCVVFMVYR